MFSWNSGPDHPGYGAVTYRRPRSLPLRSGLVLVALFAAGCASATVEAGSPAGVEGGSVSGGSALPDVVVNDVGAGGEISLQTLAPSDRPTLLWFWAPH